MHSLNPSIRQANRAAGKISRSTAALRYCHATSPNPIHSLRGVSAKSQSLSTSHPEPSRLNLLHCRGNARLWAPSKRPSSRLLHCQAPRVPQVSGTVQGTQAPILVLAEETTTAVYLSRPLPSFVVEKNQLTDSQLYSHQICVQTSRGYSRTQDARRVTEVRGGARRHFPQVSEFSATSISSTFLPLFQPTFGLTAGKARKFFSDWRFASARAGEAAGKRLLVACFFNERNA